MVNGNTVRPVKWRNVLDLYDDGEYSLIWGNYDGNSKRCLVARWNGGPNDVGYPNQGANPTWYVEPDFFANDILFAIYKFVTANSKLGNLQNIKTALSENL